MVEFPDTRQALGPDSDAPGLLCVGPSVTADHLEQAYRRGIFPWYSKGQPPLWWSPEPRMALRVADFRLHRSLRKTLRHFIADPHCEIRIDADFGAVMRRCAASPREGQSGTWIMPELVAAYTELHHRGHAHSVETWVDGERVGGLYGVSIGRMFFGESMFSDATDASKVALAALVAFCRAEGIELIDCQQATGHLASLGAREMSREAFEAHLHKAVKAPAPKDWTYHSRLWAELGLEPRASAVTDDAAAGPQSPPLPKRPLNA